MGAGAFWEKTVADMARRSHRVTRTVAVLTGLALLALPLAVSETPEQRERASEGQGPNEPGQPGDAALRSERGGDRGQDDEDGESDEDEDDGDPSPHQRAGHAAIKNNTSVQGRYVAFGINPENGTITDFVIHGTVWFDVIHTPGPFDAEATGGAIWLTGQDFEVHVSDSPISLIRFATSNDTASLTFVPNEDADRDTRNGYDAIRVAGRDGYFVGGTGHDPVLLADGGFFKLRASSVDDVTSLIHSQQDQIELAIAQGYIGAQIQLLADGFDVLAYRPINADVQTIGNGSTRFIVDADLTEGTTVIADIDPAHLDADRVLVRYLREHMGVLAPGAIKEAAGLTDVLRAEAHEGVEYWWFSDPGGLHVMVSFPQFSTQAFEVEGLSAPQDPIILYGAAAGGLVVLVASAGLMGRRGPPKPYLRRRRYPQTPQSP
jgi:hypothetical protein